MESTDLPAISRPGLLRSCWLPVLLSLTVHALLALALTALPSISSGEDHFLEVNTCVIGDLTLGLDLPRRGSLDSEPPPLLEVSVGEPAVSPSTSGKHETPPNQPGAVSEGSPIGDGSTEGTGQGSGWTGPAIFQVKGSGHSVVYVIDRSLSMGLNGALGSARRELLASLDRLPETVRFQVILYNRQAEPLRLDGHWDLVPATAANRQRVAELVEALRAEGGTDHLAALRRALVLQPEVLFFITDAAELTPQQVRTVTQQNQGRTAIHAIELSGAVSGSSADNPLSLLARSNRGTYRGVYLGNVTRER